jgi:opine dehydrogenase
MEIAVLGGGHGCYAAAVEMSELGHNVRFWRRDAQAFAPVLETGAVTVIDYKGEREVSIHKATSDLAEAMRGAQLVLLPLPATTHEGLAPQVAPLFEEGQVAFFGPGTFGSYIFAKAMLDAGNTADVSFAETGTCPYLVRKRDVRKIAISVYATRLPTGVLPARNTDHAFALLEQAYPCVERCGDALSGALMNAGAIIHTPVVMMNAGPLQHFDKWDIHNEGTQQATRAVTDALDAERIAVREALGYGAPHFPLADHYSDDGEEWMYGRDSHKRLTDSGDWREDIDLHQHRYVTEDGELGLALIASCADYAGVEAPVAKGLLAMESAIVGRDFRQTGRTLEKLGLAGLAPGELKALLHDGLNK